MLNERLLTETLRFFLDSNENHGLKSAFLRRLCPDIDWPRNSVVTAVSEWSAYKKKRRIDIVVIVSDADTMQIVEVIGIEAKIKSKDSNKQIPDYQDALVAGFPKVKKRRLLYLTIDGSLPKNGTSKAGKDCAFDIRSWVQVRDIAICLCDDKRRSFVNGVLDEFHARIDRLIATTSRKAISFFDGVAVAASEMGEAKFSKAWYYPDKKVPPDEFNFRTPYLKKMENLLPNTDLVLMFKAPDGPARAGSQVHLMLMCLPKKPHKSHSKANKGRLQNLYKALSHHHRGKLRGWNAWFPLWPAGCLTIGGFNENSKRQLARMLVSAEERLRIVKAHKFIP